MVLDGVISIYPEPPPLHTEGEFHAIGRPEYEKGGSELHWFDWWRMLSVTLRSFGFPAALYERCAFPLKEREDAFALVRMLEGALRRILLIMAGEDTRPLEPWMPKEARAPAKDETKTCRERQEWRGFAPEKMPIRFPLYVPAAASRTAPAPKRAPKPIPEWQMPPKCLTEPLPPELDTRQTRRSHRLLLADHWRGLKERKRVPVFSLVARFEALIRVYKNPKPYVMRLRQRIAAEQGRLARFICTRMLTPPARIKRMPGGILESVLEPARAVAAVLLSGRSPPIVCA